MNNVKLYIDDILIDLDDKQIEALSTTYSIATASEINVGASSFSHTLTTPLTHSTRIAFGFPEDVNSIDSFPQKYEKTARILEDGVEIFIGIARIKNSAKNIYSSGKVSFYLLGDNGDWMVQFSQRNTEDLDYSQYDHIYSETAALDSETSSDPYVYDIANRGQVTFQEKPDRLSLYDRYPAMNLKDIILKMYSDAGYSVESSFFDSDFFSQLYLPFVNEQLRITSDDTIYNRFRAKNNSADLVTGVSVDFYTLPYDQAVTNGSGVSPYYGFPFSSLHFDTSNHWYEVPRNQKAKFYADVKLRWVYSTPSGDAVADAVLYIINQETGTPTAPYGGRILAERVVHIPEGEEKTFRIESDVALVGTGSKVMVKAFFSDDFTNLGLAYFEDDSTFWCDVDYQLCEGNEFYFSENMPDINQLDLISGIKQLFNLHFSTDLIDKKVYIEPHDDFYNEGNYVNWTDKLDVSKDILISDLNSKYKKTMCFDYKSDGSDGLVNYLKESEQDTFNYDAQVENVNSKDEVGILENPLFSGTWPGNYRHIGMWTDQVPRLWKSYESGQIPPKNVNFNFRIWYYDGQKDFNEGSFIQKTFYNPGNYTFTDTERTDNYPYFYSINVNESNENSLFFRDETNSSGLFQRYWRNSFNILNNGKKYVAYFNLNKKDINTLDLRKLVLLYLDGEPVLFKIDKVAEYKSGQITKVELVTWINPVKIAEIVQGSSEIGVLLSFPEPRSIEGGFVTTLEEGVYTVKRSTATGFEVVLKASKGLIHAGDTIEALTVDTNNNLINAYTLIDGNYVKAATQE